MQKSACCSIGYREPRGLSDKPKPSRSSVYNECLAARRGQTRTQS